MKIDDDDTIETLRLKLRIIDLERENYFLRSDKCIMPSVSIFSDVSDLPLTDISPNTPILRIIASWDVKMDGVRGGYHAVGRSYTDTGFQISYFCEDISRATRSYQERVLTDMHKRVMFQILKAS